MTGYTHYNIGLSVDRLVPMPENGNSPDAGNIGAAKVETNRTGCNPTQGRTHDHLVIQKQSFGQAGGMPT